MHTTRGAGYNRIKSTRKVIKGSAILALTVEDPFDKYILCEESAELLTSVRARVARLAPQTQAAYIQGSCDTQIERICREIPTGSATSRVLNLCLVDPFDFGIKFETLRRLSNVFVDFVVLLAIGMDANRNYDHYVDGNSTKIDEALGNAEWRERWKAEGVRRADLRRFLAAEFSRSMKALRYLEQPLDRMRLVRSDEKNLPLYYLALFSRHPTALRSWEEVLNYGDHQRDLFE